MTETPALFGVEGVVGYYAVLPHWGVLGGYFAKRCIKEALGHGGVAVGNEGGAAEVVGVVVAGNNRDVSCNVSMTQRLSVISVFSRGGHVY